jgi:acetylornithine deacetylase/succinyl-diaminopimelate desuccinylase-like protein
VNAIAGEAHLELDLRSEEIEALEDLSSQVEALIEAGRQPRVEVISEVTGQRPAGEIPLDHPLVQLAIRCVETQGVQPRFNIGSTDANIPLSRGLPAICIGLTTGCNAHTTREAIQIAPLAHGLAQLMMLVREIFRKNNHLKSFHRKPLRGVHDHSRHFLGHRRGPRPHG